MSSRHLTYRSWPVALLAASVLLLAGVAALQGLLSRADTAHARSQNLHLQCRALDHDTAALRAELYHLGTLTRDFLLEPAPNAAHYHSELRLIRSRLDHEMVEIRSALDRDNGAGELDLLERELRQYIEQVGKLLEQPPRNAIGLAALRYELLRHHSAASEAIAGLVEVTDRAGRRREQELDGLMHSVSRYALAALAVLLACGSGIAVWIVLKMRSIERQSAAEAVRAAKAEQDLHALSRRFMGSQEEERRALARELHDEVGQLLTAQRMELRRLRRLRTAPDEEFEDHLEHAAELSETALRSVRALAMGLRPSMLDDFGLGPALEWQRREFQQRYAVPVELHLDGPVGEIGEPHRTCVYRLVQESLTNCARHSRARSVAIAVAAGPDQVRVTVTDDGVGFDPIAAAANGAGLVGLRERVNELAGTLRIESRPGGGTVVAAELPLKMETAVHA